MMRALVFLSCIVIVGSFSPPKVSNASPRSVSLRLPPLLASLPTDGEADLQALPTPSSPTDGITRRPSLPEFSWRRALFFCLNPAALVPLPLIANLFRVNILGEAFRVSRGKWLS